MTAAHARSSVLLETNEGTFGLNFKLEAGVTKTGGEGSYSTEQEGKKQYKVRAG